METVPQCRYVEAAAAHVVAGIVARPGAGPSFRLEEGMWLIPVTWQAGGRLRLSGEVRVRVQDHRTAEVLLVVEEGGGTDAELVLDALLDGFGPCSMH